MKKRYYFLGICGISMATLAIFLKNKGNFVQGSDRQIGKTAIILKQDGIDIDTKLNRKNIQKAAVVVCSSAIKDDNPQKIYAKKLNKKIVSRGEILGDISKQYQTVIAIAGSHGKTTTTALVYEILKTAGKNPTLHLGGYRIEDGCNFHIGDKEFFVTEACEYCDNFLFLHPKISVITNIEKEHMDYFKTFERQIESFKKFESQSQCVINSLNGYSAENIFHSDFGGLNFSIFKNNEKIMDVCMQIFEEVNVFNVIYAYQVAKKLGISDDVCKKAFENFKGVETRFQKVSCSYFDSVFCDYAHHPTEISKTIETANKIFKGRQIVFIFQPHTFSRTKTLLSEFINSLSKTENLILFKTYSAREKPSEGVSAYKLSKILKECGKKVSYYAKTESLCKKLKRLNKQCVIVFVGAGDLQMELNKRGFIS